MTRARPKLPIVWNWVLKNIPDEQKCVGFPKKSTESLHPTTHCTQSRGRVFTHSYPYKSWPEKTVPGVQKNLNWKKWSTVLVFFYLLYTKWLKLRPQISTSVDIGMYCICVLFCSPWADIFQFLQSIYMYMLVWSILTYKWQLIVFKLLF